MQTCLTCLINPLSITPPLPLTRTLYTVPPSMHIPSILRSKSYKGTDKSDIMASQQQTPPAQQAQAPPQDQQQQQQTQATHTREQEIELYGWAAVPRSNDAILAMAEKVPEAPLFDIAELEQSVPQSNLAKQVEKYARDNLPMETFNHSMRVFLYGKAPQIQLFRRGGHELTVAQEWQSRKPPSHNGSPPPSPRPSTSPPSSTTSAPPTLTCPRPSSPSSSTAASPL